MIRLPDTSLSLSFRALLLGIVAISLLLGSLALRDKRDVFEPPLYEDGYYMQSVARNLGLGNGLTIDGTQPTNGVQPLFTFLAAPLHTAAQGDRYGALRFVLLLHWAIHLTTSALLARIVRRILQPLGDDRARAGSWIAMFLWIASAQVLIHSYNGLETGLVLLLYALVWHLHQLQWFSGWRLGALGAVLGLLVLARIDTAVFVAILALSEVARHGLTPRQRLTRGAALAVVPLVVSSPWFVYNLLLYGSPMPSSGLAQTNSLWASHASAMMHSLLDTWVPILPFTTAFSTPARAVLIHGLQVLVFAPIALRFVRLHGTHMRANSWRIGISICISTSVLCVLYFMFSGAEHFYGRYLSPFMLFAVPAAAVSLTEPGLIPRIERGLIAVLAGAFALTAIGSWQFGWVGQISKADRNVYYHEQFRLVKAHVPPDELVGAGQSGTLGYFRDHVVNLDGKVNAEVLDSESVEMGMTSRLEYLDRKGIEWYCDGADYAQAHLGSDPEMSDWVLVDQLGRFVLFRRTGEDAD